MRHETRVFVAVEVRGEECLTLAFCPIFLQGYEWCQVIDAVWLYVNAPGKQSKTISGVNKTIKVRNPTSTFPGPRQRCSGPS